MAGNLEGKTVAVTGAASGIWRATALAFAAAGARVVAADVDPGGLEETSRLLLAQHAECRTESLTSPSASRSRG